MKWKDEEVKFLIENWKKLRDKDLAKILKRSIQSVGSKRRKLGLKKPERHPTPLPKFDKNFAYIIGVIWGDGWVSGRNEIGLASKEKNFVLSFKKTLEKMGI